MTNHVVRLYAFAAALLIMFVSWTTIAARPWVTHTSAAADPRLAALAVREQRIRHEAVTVQRVVARRWHHYRVRLAARKRAIAVVERKHRQALAAASLAVSSYSAGSSSGSYSSAAPSVRVVTLPPITVTRTS